MIYTAENFYDMLLSEDSNECLYRGQTQAYPGPLWPSVYRSYKRSSKPIDVDRGKTFRGIGGRFYLKSEVLNTKGFATNDQIKNFSKEFYLREYLKLHIRNSLGYPLTEAFCQQTGLRSEGLDVTRSIPVALFFACYDFKRNSYERKTANVPSIIYRWRVKRRNWSLDDLNTIEFKNCPNLVPTKEILSLFPKCDNILESQESLDDYKESIKWNWYEFSLKDIQGKRPFEIISFPEFVLNKSRVYNQEACLMIPDYTIAEMPRGRPETHGEKDALLLAACISDQSAYCRCEKFFFNTDGIEKIVAVQNLDTNIMFPEHDILFSFLRDWIGDLFLKIPPGLNPQIMDREFLKIKMSQMEFMEQVAKGLENRFFI